MLRMLRDHLEFFRQFRTQFHTTGALAPSSRFLARAMIAPLGARRMPARILEVGPGTGAVTRWIVSQLQPGDRLDLVELNGAFAALLQKRYGGDPRFQRCGGAVHVCGIEAFEPEAPYDYVISGLPFNNFSPDLVERLLTGMMERLAPCGVLSFFEYMYVRPLRQMVSASQERSRLRDLGGVMQSFISRHGFRRDWVFLNVPPAWVQHLRKD
jgi:phospholipid N-methyltransferase